MMPETEMGRKFRPKCGLWLIPKPASSRRASFYWKGKGAYLLEKWWLIYAFPKPFATHITTLELRWGTQIKTGPLSLLFDVLLIT